MLKLLWRHSDEGVRNLAADIALLPRNPFEPERRRSPKREVLTIALLLLLLLAAAIWFNLRALP
jgi:ferric-dicitrate binding protein FerR (iron transport regulator)